MLGPGVKPGTEKKALVEFFSKIWKISVFNYVNVPMFICLEKCNAVMYDVCISRSWMKGISDFNAIFESFFVYLKIFPR